MRLRPAHGILVVAFFVGTVLVAEKALEKNRGRFLRVAPAADGQVRIDVAGLMPGQVRWFDFLDRGNREVHFLVARDTSGGLQVAFDAAENDFKRGLGFRQEGDWLVNNKCGTPVRLEQVNAGTSGCRPTPLPFRVDGNNVLLREDDVLVGWRYFR